MISFSALRNWVLSLMVLGTACFADAEIVIIESRTTGGTTGGITANPPYLESAPSWSGSGSHTIAPGTTPGIGSRFAFSGTPQLTLTPTLQSGSKYRMSISHISINASPNIVVNISYVGCTGTATSTTAFNSAVGNVWEVVGEITVDEGVTQPQIIFTYASGTLASSGGRWYSDAFKFQNDPCIFSTLPELVGGATGPLAAGQTFVNVPAVASGATAVSVYADGVLIGRKTSGITAGQNRVDTTTPLTKGQVITVTQSDSNGVECCRATSGPIVGGGANPPFAVALSVRQDATLTGPIGANGGGGSTIIKFLAATNLVASGGAPAGAKTFAASSAWQTVQFLRGDDPANPTDPTFLWNGTDTANGNKLVGDYGVLDGLAIAVQNDTGPYAIYIDDFRNGSTQIQGFEGFAPGTLEVLFTRPAFSGTTSPFLLSAAANVFSPNVSMVTNNTADEGSHCLFVNWQFKDTNRINWLRLPSPSAALGSPNPIIDLRQPISFRMLILPPGQEPPQSAPVFSQGPASQTVIRGGSATMRVNVRGTPTLQYQWLFNGAELTGRTSSTLTVTNVQAADAGRYSVRVSNSLGSAVSPEGILTVEDVPYTDVMTPMWRIAIGARAYLANDNNTRSIAYSPLSGNLLLASRTGSNAIHVLNGDTGAYRHTLPAPLGGFAGGTFALNMIAVAPDGSVYAANLTEDGATNNLKIYKWIDDTPEGGGAVVWEGNPSGDPNVHARWGDTMVVQGASGDHELIFSSRDGALLSSIRPDFGPGAPPVVMDVAGAVSGNLRIGLAIAGTDALWGKQIGLPLIHVALDPNRFSASVDRAYSTVGNMSAIGFDPVNNLIAGVFVETPDNLRLFDASNPSGLFALDTELFPSDNANANASGAVAFGPNRVYALDSNNGIIAMNLNLACLPDALHIERSGANVLITWNRPSSRLQGAPALAGASTVWTDIPGTMSATVPAGSGNRFFRLICP